MARVSQVEEGEEGLIPREVQDWVDAVYSRLTEEERKFLGIAHHTGVPVEKVSELSEHVERKYWNQSPEARAQLLMAYVKSSRRDPDAFLVDRGVYVEDHVPSDRYREHLFR